MIARHCARDRPAACGAGVTFGALSSKLPRPAEPRPAVQAMILSLRAAKAAYLGATVEKRFGRRGVFRGTVERVDAQVKDKAGVKWPYLFWIKLVIVVAEWWVKMC